MKPRVIAIALDSVPEPVLRRLLGEEELPSIGALLATGEMSNVGPSAAIGSMSVWPSFASGLPADEHRFVHDWLWDPDAMRVRRARWNADEPFWEALAAEGCRSVVLDVPFVRQRAKRDLFTIEGWGCHEGPGGPTRAQPASLRGLLRRAGRHPYYAIRQDPGTATGHVESSRRLSQLSIEGIRTRARLGEMLVRDLEPDLLLLNFPEIHLGTHQLLHLVSPEHPCSQNGELRDLYLDLFREMDRAVGRIVDAAPTGTSVILFSLLGMRPARGNPLLHAPRSSRGDTLAPRPRHGRPESGISVIEFRPS
ncbi:MAG TPA: alkaline phosphatase family protein [Thermoanaerobaculia bacterium]|nr:alkaline phosphatase family protein [Thermoanaerobaculia bacterium]